MRILQMGERQWVTLALFLLAFMIIGLMAAIPDLRKDDLFKVLAQAIVLTAVVNGIVAFHFSSNKGSETARENTGKAFDAIAAAVNPTAPGPVADHAAQAVAAAAQETADAIRADAAPEVPLAAAEPPK